MQFGGNRKTWLRGAIAALGVVVIVSYTPGWYASRRAPSEYETILYYFAQNLGETALCDQMSWAGYNSYGILFGGGGASLWRSDCYERVAQARHDPSICWRVRPLLDLDPFSSGHSAFSCWRRSGSGYKSGIGLPYELLIRTFREMHYDIDHMPSEGVFPPAIRTDDVYRGLQKNAAALGAAQQLVARGDGVLQADDRSFLAQLAAVATGNPNWCGYIPPGEYVKGVRSPFRDWCFFTVGVNARDPRICDRMTPADRDATVVEARAAGVRPEIAEQLGLRSQCIRSKDAPGPPPHYSPQTPSDEQQTRRLIHELGVVFPSANDWPAPSIANYFRQFLFALEPGTTANPARDRARADLVRRLIALGRPPPASN